MKQEEQVLLYRFDDTARLAKAAEVCRTLKIRVKVLEKEDFCQKVGFLLGMKGFLAAKQEDAFDFPHEVAILHNLKGKRLDALLLAWNAALSPKIAYRSVVTPFNVLWTLERLCIAMQKEHGILAEGVEE